MIRYALLPAAAVAALAAPVAAAEIQMTATNPVVELSVTEIVRSAPDMAQIGAGVQTRANTAQEAVRENARAMDRIIARLREMGIERRDIQTSNFSLNPQYNYNREGAPPTFVGYDATNQVQVKLRRLDRVGEVLDALVATGANNIYGPNFMLEDDMEAKAEARADAFKRGRSMAETYARMAGYNGVKLLAISETFQSYGPQPVAMQARLVSEDAGGPPTPIEPGEVGTAATITVKYEMTR